MSDNLSTSTLSTVGISLFSSLLFLILLSRFKPKIRICDTIAYQTDKDDSDDKLYFVKIINKSWFYAAYDIKVKAYSCETIPTQNGEDISYTEIPLRKSDHWILPRINRKHLWQDFFQKKKRLNTRTDYAAQFSTYFDLLDCLNNNRYITFEVIAKHSLTGFSVIKSKPFKHINNIEEGNFFSGNTFQISK